MNAEIFTFRVQDPVTHDVYELLLGKEDYHKAKKGNVNKKIMYYMII